MRNKMYLSIIIPSFNEGHLIGNLLEQIDVNLLGELFEVIVIDDGSTDNTEEVVKDFPRIKYYRQSNQGKGAAVREGAKIATGDFIGVLDADNEYSVEDLLKCAAQISHEPKRLVYGSRYKLTKFPYLRFKPLQNQSILNLYFNHLLSLVFFSKQKIYISDLLTGTKIYPRIEFVALDCKTNGFETDHELTLGFIKLGFSIIEVPINYFPRNKKEGKKITFKDALKALQILRKNYIS